MWLWLFIICAFTYNTIFHTHTHTETENAGHLITTITAKDLDSGKFGDQGIRYSLSGNGSNLFHVNNVTGAITVAPCAASISIENTAAADNIRRRRRRDTFDSNVMQQLYDDVVNDAKNVNLTLVGESGIIPMDDASTHMEIPSTAAAANNDAEYSMFTSNDEYVTMHDMNMGEGDGGGGERDGVIDKHEEEHYLAFDVTSTMRSEEATTTTSMHSTFNSISDDGINSIKPGVAPCLDFETQPVYFLSYKVSGYMRLLFFSILFLCMQRETYIIIICASVYNLFFFVTK